MRVLFPDISNPQSGRSHFLVALAKELPENDCEVVFGDAEHDISLHPIRMWCKSSKPRILRLDGVYHDIGKANRVEKNASMMGQCGAADGIICQSEFSKGMVMSYCGVKKKKIQVIFNGASTLYRNCTEHNSDFKYNFIAASRWRPHKRLKDTIESFKIANIESSLLYVFGDVSNNIRDICSKYDNIILYGNFPHDILLSSFPKATASIHLCWFDSCPNSVVESIVAGCPVITNNVGGTHEIVRPSGGIVLDLDQPYDYRPVDLYHPPAIDRYKVAEAMRKCAESRPVITSDHVNIKNIAKQYADYFRRFV